MKVVGLFAGIGGIELGFKRAGFQTHGLCEFDPAAKAVLAAKFPETPIWDDVREVTALPEDTSVLTAGFPCQDLSQAGNTKGIDGERSGLVRHVFRLLDERRVPWVVIENVSFMLRLDRGSAMRFIAKEFESRGYRWAYRVLDSRAFGVPQRRERVYFVASLDADPATLLFADDVQPRERDSHFGLACGFYWTEGTRGLGWGVDCIPTLKGGSSLGIASPPAIWMPDGSIVTPEIRDAERLQGFESDWTLPAEPVGKRGCRWRLVGNAVTVGAAEWVARAILAPASRVPARARPIPAIGGWPPAGFGGPAGRFEVAASSWPVALDRASLDRFLIHPPKPLSARATRGFLVRLRTGTLKRPAEFEAALQRHLESMENSVAA